MHISLFLFWFSNLYIGQFIFLYGYRTNLNHYYLSCITLFFGYLFSDFSTEQTPFLNFIMASSPFSIGGLPILIDVTAEKRNLEKSINQIIIFLDITLANIKFGRSVRESMFKSSRALIKNNHLVFTLKKNVVLQQPKSRFYKIFHEFESDLNKILSQKMSQKDLLTFTKHKYQKKLTLFQKTKISLSQYKSQTIVIFSFWILAFSFLVFQKLAGEYILTVLLSLFLNMFGVVVSKKVLTKSEFRF